MDFLNPKSILVVQIGKIGDMILTTPLFTALKKLFPSASLRVLASEFNKDIPLNHDAVNEVVIYKKNFLKNILFPNPSLLNIDLWIDTKDNYSKSSAFLVKIFKPEHSLGFNFTKKIFEISLNQYVNGTHSVDVNLSPINYIKNENKRSVIRPSFNIPVEVGEKIKKIFIPGQLNLLINISAGNESRYLDNGKWINLINNINRDKLFTITLIGLNRDEDRINEIINSTGGNTSYIKTNNILEVAEIIRRCDIVITPDTSVIHICSVFNTPVTGLYPNVTWNLDKFKPLSDQNEIIISKDKESISDIQADEVLESFKRLAEKIK
ncbi:MAG: glycosyltransferase family 9 protein [bacterium]